MDSPDAIQGRIAVLEERLSTLCAAILRISASLDVDAVLQEAVDSARALTGARYGVITTVGSAGSVREFLTSGFTPAEQQQMADWQDGLRLLKHFRDLQAPLRLSDLPAYARALGYSDALLRSQTLLGTPMRHRDEHVGEFFLAEKEGGREFTEADEQVVVLFASQAAAAIANARTHRDERRARADLETLVETAPVGVVVFDGETGRPVWVNRETMRIVENLRLPDRPPDQLLDLVTCRRADGREVALGEFPLAKQFSSGETVRAEEMTLSVAGGQSVTTLVNSTPIRLGDSAVESVVVTLQDLAPLVELERMRAEFLGLVSHELRGPLTSIKGSATTVLDASPPPGPAEMLQFFQVINEQVDQMRSLIRNLLDHGRILTGTLSVSPELAEVTALVDEACRAFQGAAGRRPLTVDLQADLPSVMADRPRIIQVLNNLFSNAVMHSPAPSPIRVEARREGAHVAVSVADKGHGVPAEQMPHLFRKHAVADAPGDRGAGLGLAICRGLVEAHGGRIWAESGAPGWGTRVIFTLPLAAGADEAVPPPGRAQTSPKNRGRTRILAVDDDPQMLRYVRDALSAAGYDVAVTGEPGEMAGLVRTHRPALVLLDLVLPGADGIELLGSVPELNDLPVILISSHGREETIVRALDSGAADYIVKPFSRSELAARVRAALRRRPEPDADGPK